MQQNDGVRIGILGLGNRGREQTKLLATMEDVNIRAVCDLLPDRVESVLADLERAGRGTVRGETQPDRVLAAEDIDAVVIMTDWETHIDLACRAMRAGKRAAMEVGGASSVAECRELIRVSRETGKDAMLLENCCYGRTEMTLLNMIRRGVFGEIVHCQGGYEHDLRGEIGFGDRTHHYRQKHFLARNGELYPTHELGPIMEYLDIGRGNRMVSLVSMASRAAGLSAYLRRERPGDPVSDARVRQGDVVTTMISCARGETILLTHDCTLPRPYSRGGRVQGTRAIWMEDNRSIHVDGVTPRKPEDWSHSWESDAAYMEQYEHPLWKEYREAGEKGGHDGMDYLALRAFIEAVQQGTPFPIDVYDAAQMMCVTPLSEQSIALGSAPVPIPDMTDGAWLTRKDESVGKYRLGR